MTEEIKNLIAKLMHWSKIIGDTEDEGMQAYAMLKISETFKLNGLDWDEMFDKLNKEMDEFIKFLDKTESELENH